MTNMRLKTCMFEDLKFCSFCGRELRMISEEMKRCGFHMLIVKAEENEDDELL